jgi:hypothetical protein
VFHFLSSYITLRSTRHQINNDPTYPILYIPETSRATTFLDACCCCVIVIVAAAAAAAGGCGGGSGGGGTGGATSSSIYVRLSLLFSLSLSLSLSLALRSSPFFLTTQFLLSRALSLVGVHPPSHLLPRRSMQLRARNFDQYLKHINLQLQCFRE